MSFLKELCLLALMAGVVDLTTIRERNKKPYNVFCYIGSYANYRTGDARFVIEHIDPNMCTHLVYGYAKVINNAIVSFDPDLDLKERWGRGAYERFNNLKKINPQLTTMIAVGSRSEDNYSAIAASAANREIFVESVVDFLLKYNFDGLALDWKFPAYSGGVPEDKENFVSLLKQLQEAFEPYDFLLSSAVSGIKSIIDAGYNIPEVSKYLDFINVMTYDLHGSWEKLTGHPAPLREREGEPISDKNLNVDFAINYWIRQGARRQKIILGIGFYGRSFTLEDPNVNGLGSPAAGPGSPGPMTKEPGMLGYNEICLKLKKEGWVFAAQSNDPYAYHKNQWVGYDNIKSIERKLGYIMRRKLGGGMVWSLEHDDFRGKCHVETYPLLSAVYTKLNGPVERATVLQEDGTSNPERKIFNYPAELLKCDAEGYLDDPSNNNTDSCPQPCTSACVQWRK